MSGNFRDFYYNQPFHVEDNRRRSDSGDDLSEYMSFSEVLQGPYDQNWFPGSFGSTSNTVIKEERNPAVEAELPATPSISSSSEAAMEDLSKNKRENPDGSNKKLEVKMEKKGEKKLKEPRFAFMTKSEVDHLEDGYRWRKYGQKAVKNSSYPRSYYRCTTQKCSVKKRVERSYEDPSTVITTYEGQHNHNVPTSLRGNVAGMFSSSMLTTPPPSMETRISFPQQLFTLQIPQTYGGGISHTLTPPQQQYQIPDYGRFQDISTASFPKPDP